ncbi:hypothetical protein BLNAU_10189 [Blattamonas nauphoetae]|uniref:Protein kinase domain-containing protein n=1 Tax=Blattamonas nauphoetae TaxID=2049346 RepID=A0ABQ9XTR0_9EUKA|nr:hypothetical protein BLNAU_10189 [Blattamonas nauphoetae]
MDKVSEDDAVDTNIVKWASEIGHDSIWCVFAESAKSSWIRTGDLGGSAPLDKQLTSTIGEMGTFEYNSPERLLDSKGTATPVSDVWSLGVLAYRMVTGKSLFDGLHLLQMSASLHSFDETKIPLSIDPSVREVLLKMLEPNVALRATTTTLFEGGLLERMLGAETGRSKMKNIQLATQVNEIKESLSDSKVK